MQNINNAQELLEILQTSPDKDGKWQEANALWWRAWKKVVTLTARKDNAEKAKTNYKIQSVSNPTLMSMCDIGVSRARLLL